MKSTVNVFQYHRLSSTNANNVSFDLGSAFINNPVQKEWN